MVMSAAVSSDDKLSEEELQKQNSTTTSKVDSFQLGDTPSEEVLVPMAVADINVMTERARALPPSGDQAHVLMSDGEDPWVISHEGNLYYCSVDRAKTSVQVSKFSDIEDMSTATLHPVWPTPHGENPDFLEIWAPELQRVDGKWYIYLALYKGDGIGQERMHVLEGVTDDPQGEYVYKGQLTVPTDRWAIDGTILEIPGREEKYFVWSGWEGNVNHSQNIYIARMKNPWTLDSDRVLISQPEFNWERSGYPYINEGPQVLIRNGKVFIIYSASGSWTNDYCLGQLQLVGNDPLDPQSWVKKPIPVFEKTDTIFGPGHCSFLKQEDGTDVLLYHSQRSSGAGWARQVRYKKFTWNEDDSPNFGKPL